MASNQIEDLRKVLFITLHRLLNKENPMDIDQAKAVAQVAQVIVNSAKVEVDFIKEVGGNGSGFLTGAPRPPLAILIEGEENEAAK